jgi:hypothetical protein
MLGFIGLLLVFVTPMYLAHRGIAGTFHASLLCLFAAPFAFGVIGKVLYQYSWWLARRKGFHYDYDQCEASWMEAGQRRFYRWKA